MPPDRGGFDVAVCLVAARATVQWVTEEASSNDAPSTPQPPWSNRRCARTVRAVGTVDVVLFYYVSRNAGPLARGAALNVPFYLV